MSGPRAGRWEARITVPSGGWAYDGTHAGGIAAGTYYLPGLLAAITGGVDFALTAAGQVVVSHAFDFDLTWTDAEFRDLLGFTGNLAGDFDSYTGANHVQALWLPDTAKISPYGDGDPGDLVTDGRSSISPRGDVFSFLANRRRELQGIEYRGLSFRKTRTSAEVLANESLETFVRDGIWGEAPWATAGGPVRFYWREDDLDTFHDFYAPLSDWGRIEYRQLQEHFVGLWTVELPVLVEVP